MFAVNVIAGQRNRVFLLSSDSVLKSLREKLIISLETEKFRLKAKLGDVDVGITNEEEFLVISAYHGDSGLPLQVTVHGTEEEKLAGQLNFGEIADHSLIWVGGIPKGSSKDDVLAAIASAIHAPPSNISIGLLEAGTGETMMALVSIASVQDAAASASAVEKISGVEANDSHYRAVAANGIKPLEAVEVAKTPAKPAGKKNRKGSKAKRASLTVTPMVLKAWKFEYLKRVCRNDLMQISVVTNVQIVWSAASSLSLSGKSEDVKDARRDIENLVSRVLSLGSLTIPCPDTSFQIRVINQCRILEKELGVVLLIDNLLTPKAGNSEDDGSTLVTVAVIGTEKEQYNDVKKKLSAIPKQIFEVKCHFNKEEFKKIRQTKADELAVIKKDNKIYQIKIWKNKVILRGTILEALQKAEGLIKNLLPLSISSGGNFRVSIDAHSDSFVPMSPTHNDFNEGGRISEIDVAEIRAWNPKTTHLSLDAMSSPNTGSVASPTSPLSPSLDDAKHDIDVDEEPAQAETIETQADEEELPERANDPDLPETWDFMPEHVNCVATLMEPDSEEYNMVKNSLDFIPASIKSVERIQNKKLFRGFQAIKQDQVAQGKSAETSYLWCGTMASSPEEVYDGERGFSLQVDGQGTFQFWKKASYCNVFGYSTADGSKQLFLAETLTGGKSKMQVKGVPAYPTYLLTLKMKTF